MTSTINEEMIKELKELMAEDFPVLIETFIIDCEKRLVELTSAIADNNATEVREVAHGFKGSSSNLGAEKLAEICFTLESMGRTDDLTGAEAAFKELRLEYSTVSVYFKSLL